MFNNRLSMLLIASAIALSILGSAYSLIPQNCTWEENFVPNIEIPPDVELIDKSFVNETSSYIFTHEYHSSTMSDDEIVLYFESLGMRCYNNDPYTSISCYRGQVTPVGRYHVLILPDEQARTVFRVGIFVDKCQAKLQGLD